MTNEMPPRLAKLYAMALSLNLNDPLGRAVYACNRRYNGGFSMCTDQYILSAAKETTAARWREHWESGGGLKSLAHRRKGWQPPPVVPMPTRGIALGGIE